MIKWIIGVIIIVAAGAALMWSGVLGKIPPAQPVTETPAAQAPAQTADATKPVPVNDLPTQTTDASDTAIAQDTASVDAQIQALATDSSGVDSSLSDKTVAQEF